MVYIWFIQERDKNGIRIGYDKNHFEIATENMFEKIEKG